MAVNTSVRRSKFSFRFAALFAVALMPLAAAGLLVSQGSSSAQAASTPVAQDHDLLLAIPQGDGPTQYVTIEMLMMPTGSNSGDQAAADNARAEMTSRFPGAYQIDENGVTAQFVTNGFKWALNSASWGYDSSGEKVAGAAAVSAAAATWGATGSNFHFLGGGGGAFGTGACGGGTDGHNTVGWGQQSGQVLAVTCSWWSGGNATEFDMQISPSWSWTTGSSPTVDLQSVVTHEFGHALGLNHSPLPSAMMYASYTAGTLKRDLTDDDIQGEMAIYGGAGGGITPNPTATPITPTATPTRTATPSPTATQPTATQPTATQPTATQPTATQPTATQPTATQPTATQPTSTQSPPTNTATPTRTATVATSTPTSGGASTTPTSTSPTAPTATPTSAATTTATPTNTRTASPTAAATPNNSLPIRPGANLLAWPGDNLPPALALGGQAGALKIVYQWDPVHAQWLRFAPGLPSFLNNLLTMSKGQAYWFIANSATQVAFAP